MKKTSSLNVRILELFPLVINKITNPAMQPYQREAQIYINSEISEQKSVWCVRVSVEHQH